MVEVIQRIGAWRPCPCGIRSAPRPCTLRSPRNNRVARRPRGDSTRQGTAEDPHLTGQPMTREEALAMEGANAIGELSPEDLLR